MKRFKKKDPQPTDEWAVSTGTFEDGPIVFRVNHGVAPLRVTHPIQIGVALPLTQPVPGGLPSPEEEQELSGAEELLLALVDDRAALVAVLTTGTMREFVLYSADEGWIEQFHHKLEAAVTTHEVHVAAKRDPEWSIYDSLVAD